MWDRLGMEPWRWPMTVSFWGVVFFGMIWARRTTTAPRQRQEDSLLRKRHERLAGGEIDPGDYEECRRLPESHR